MKQTLIDFIYFESAYKAVIYFKHREPLTVTSDKGGAAYLVAEILSPLQGAEALKTPYSNFSRHQRSLEQTQPIRIAK